MPNTGIFLNYSWLDSEVEDSFGKRKFNDQSDYVYNVGFIQDLPTLRASFGATYRKMPKYKQVYHAIRKKNLKP